MPSMRLTGGGTTILRRPCGLANDMALRRVPATHKHAAPPANGKNFSSSRRVVRRPVPGTGTSCDSHSCTPEDDVLVGPGPEEALLLLSWLLVVGAAGVVVGGARIASSPSVVAVEVGVDAAGLDPA